jgi:hypothetical protein
MELKSAFFGAVTPSSPVEQTLRKNRLPLSSELKIKPRNKEEDSK